MAENILTKKEEDIVLELARVALKNENVLEYVSNDLDLSEEALKQLLIKIHKSSLTFF